MFLKPETLGILAVDAATFAIDTATGVLMRKLMHRSIKGHPLTQAMGSPASILPSQFAT